MEIKSPRQVKEVVEYIFTFNSGMELSFTVDKAAGDTVTEELGQLIITLADKPNLLDPDEILPGEQIRVQKQTLAVMQTRKRTQRMPTPEELFEMQKTLHKQPKRVQ